MSLVKDFLETPAFEAVFIRRALNESLRLDGRQPHQSREVIIKLSRGDCWSSSEIVFGDTRVVCSVIADVSTPYPDRPTEGSIQFHADLSPKADRAGISRVDIVRMLERSIRDSDAIDTESLCILSGEKVWNIKCEITILDFAGNVMDAVSLATMAALRAFRKAEVLLERNSTIPINTDQSVISIPKHSKTIVRIYSQEEREPLPLALHHTPLCITIGIFKDITLKKDYEEESSKVEDMLLVDTSSEEEAAMDGSIMFSLNAHRWEPPFIQNDICEVLSIPRLVALIPFSFRELCAINKPGGVGVSIDVIMRASALAMARSQALHSQLSAALMTLDDRIVLERNEKIKQMQMYQALLVKDAKQI